MLAQLLVVANFADRRPQYRHEAIFVRAGLALSRPTLAQWVGHLWGRAAATGRDAEGVLLARPLLHADERSVAMLKPAMARRTGRVR